MIQLSDCHKEYHLNIQKKKKKTSWVAFALFPGPSIWWLTANPQIQWGTAAQTERGSSYPTCHPAAITRARSAWAQHSTAHCSWSTSIKAAEQDPAGQLHRKGSKSILPQHETEHWDFRALLESPGDTATHSGDHSSWHKDTATQAQLPALRQGRLCWFWRMMGIICNC